MCVLGGGLEVDVPVPGKHAWLEAVELVPAYLRRLICLRRRPPARGIWRYERCVCLGRRCYGGSLRFALLALLPSGICQYLPLSIMQALRDSTHPCSAVGCLEDPTPFIEARCGACGCDAVRFGGGIASGFGVG